MNGVHVAQYTVTGQERQHVFVQRGAGADPSRPPPVEPEPEPEPDNGASVACSRPLSRLFRESRMALRTMAICAGGDGGDMSYGGATSDSNDEVPPDPHTSTQLTYFCLRDGHVSDVVES